MGSGEGESFFKIQRKLHIVMFLYRDEVYNAESPDISTAEVLVTKHRSGPPPEWSASPSSRTTPAS